MNHTFQVVYVPIGVPTFDLNAAQAEFEKSCEVLHQIIDGVICPEQMLLSLDLLENYLDQLHPDMIILQNITFANAAYVSKVIHEFTCPVLLWTLREPAVDGGRLRLNSLTGAYSASNTLFNHGYTQMEYVFGSPSEAYVQNEIRSIVQAIRLKKDLEHLKIASVGHTPEGFGFGRALDTEMQHVFGAELVCVEARELMDLANSYTDEECAEFMQETEKCTVCFEQTPEKNRLGHARLYKAYLEYAAKNQIGALASRCWPDFFTNYGTPVCTVLSMLNDRGIAASCEADTYGALSMYVGMQLTGKAAFFGDPVSMDEAENTITYWHCGMGACSLAHPAAGAKIGVHPNRKIGPAMDFGCRSEGSVTVFRIGRKPDGSFRFFLTAGKSLDKPKQFTGTTVVVETESSSREIVESSVRDGWEPHFVVIYGDVCREIEILGRQLGIEVYRY